MAAGSGHRSPPWNAVSRARSTGNVTELITAKPSSRADTTWFRPSGSLAATALITALNQAPRRGPVAGMTASLSTLGDRQAASGWRSGQLSGVTASPSWVAAGFTRPAVSAGRRRR